MKHWYFAVIADWEARIDSHGRVFYIDHLNRTTTWSKPSTSGHQQLTLGTASELQRQQLDRRWELLHLFANYLHVPYIITVKLPLVHEYLLLTSLNSESTDLKNSYIQFQTLLQDLFLNFIPTWIQRSLGFLRSSIENLNRKNFPKLKLFGI